LHWLNLIILTNDFFFAMLVARLASDERDVLAKNVFFGDRGTLHVQRSRKRRTADLGVQELF
jgi:hypothetical protein